MKIPFVSAHVFWVPWWDVDHHVYGAPIQFTVHTQRWNLMVRPFSGFAQGGDRRGELEWRVSRQGPSPYERDRTGKWVISDEPPEIWESVTRPHRCRCRFCVWCLHDEDSCRAFGGHDGHAGRTRRPERYVRYGVFLRHVWRVHVVGRRRCRSGVLTKRS